MIIFNWLTRRDDEEQLSRKQVKKLVKRWFKRDSTLVDQVLTDIGRHYDGGNWFERGDELTVNYRLTIKF